VKSTQCDQTAPVQLSNEVVLVLADAGILAEHLRVVGVHLEENAKTFALWHRRTEEGAQSIVAVRQVRGVPHFGARHRNLEPEAITSIPQHDRTIAHRPIRQFPREVTEHV
jgi:hypothetical protein